MKDDSFIEDWDRGCLPPANRSNWAMRLGILEGAILCFLEEEAPEASFTAVSIQLDADYFLVTMAAGALVRQELIDIRACSEDMVMCLKKPKPVSIPSFQTVGSVVSLNPSRRPHWPTRLEFPLH